MSTTETGGRGTVTMIPRRLRVRRKRWNAIYQAVGRSLTGLSGLTRAETSVPRSVYMSKGRLTSSGYKKSPSSNSTTPPITHRQQLRLRSPFGIGRSAKSGEMKETDSSTAGKRFKDSLHSYTSDFLNNRFCYFIGQGLLKLLQLMGEGS